MVCVELDETSHTGQVVNVVLGNEHDDITLAHDHRGHFLVYDDVMQLQTDGEAEDRAIKIAEYREWPHQLDWEQGPDALHYPGLYDVTEPDDTDNQNDQEPLDLQHLDPTQ